MTRAALDGTVYDDLVIGPGFVGGAICRQLRDAGRDVSAVSRSGDAPEGVDGYAGDVTDGDLELPAAATLYYLVSAGGRSEATYRAAYVEGLRNVVAAAGLDDGDDTEGAGEERDAPTLVYASSTGVYGVSDGSWVDEDTPAEPATDTGAVLAEAEAVAREAGGTVVRLSGLYGPGRTGIERYLGDVTVKRGYTNRIHREDAARAMRAARAASDDGHDLYLAVDDEPVDRHDLARWLSEHTGRPHGELVDERARTHKRCRNDRLRGTGWEPAFPTYREGYRAIL